MKKFVFPTLVFFFLFLLSASISGQAEAGFLNFDQSSVSVNPQATFTISVLVDAGPDEITSTVAHILFEPSLLEAQSVTPGNFFPSVSQNITSGEMYITGIVDTPATFKTGAGTLATVTFKALKDGTASLTFFCQLGQYNSSKIIKNDFNATNIIDCSQNGSATVTVGQGGPTVTPGVSLTKPPGGKTPGISKPDDDDNDDDKDDDSLEKTKQPIYLASFAILLALVLIVLQRM